MWLYIILLDLATFRKNVNVWWRSLQLLFKSKLITNEGYWEKGHQMLVDKLKRASMARQQWTLQTVPDNHL